MIEKPVNHIDTLIIRCPNWVGDIVMAIPALDCFRDSFPRTKIIGIVKKNAQGILRDGPWFDGFIDCDDKSWAGFWRITEQIRDYKADMAVLLSNSVRSALSVWLGGVRNIYGYRRNFRGIFLKGGPEPIRNNYRIVPMPTTEYYLGICRWLGLNVPEKVQPRLFIGQQILERAESLFQKYGIRENDLVIGLNPGASFGVSKCWPPEHFAELAELCEKELGAKFLLLSGPGEEPIAQAVLKKSRADIINTYDDKVDLEMLKPLVQRCNLLITNDTGPRHYAVALDIPVVVILGPTNPDYTAANLDRTIVIRKEMDCSPCHKKICPREHQCMTEITAAEVFTAAKKLLKEQK
ncbi:MAG TPA: lipopolysaccharide heptosyltransferase II [Sedimentisphaerales bacterium]|nr:lipopolysaccharide heptosyltransferase II [Sedimentisphaerales bacterium]